MGLLPMDADILPPSDDRIFKLLLTPEEAKPVLKDLISAIIQRPVMDVVVRNCEIPPGGTDEKAARLDVNCRFNDDSQMDFEMQASRIQEESDGQHQNLKGKGVYYLCELHSSQPSKGIRRYDKLARTYQVTFCSYTVFPDRTEFVNSFSLRHDKNNELLTDAVHVIYVELSKLREIMKKPVQEMTDLEKWAVFFRYANDPRHRGTVNEVIATKEALQMAGERLMSISQDERERAILRSRKMYETDLQSNLATAEDRGIRIGKEQGIRIGEERGIRIGEEQGIRIGEKTQSIAIARAMITAGESIEKICLYTGLTAEEIKALEP